MGTFILWLGWFFFNGGSAYTLYNMDYLPGEIIVNTMIAGSTGGATSYFLKWPIHHFFDRIATGDKKKKIFRSYRAYDSASICNGV